jgi:hypothetical protein
MTMNSGELFGDVLLLGVAGMMINNAQNNNNNRNRNNNNNNYNNNNAPRRRNYTTTRKSYARPVRKTTAHRKTQAERDNRDWTLGSPFGM